jgi:hypothetical protein
MFFPGTLIALAAQWFSRVEAKLYVAHLRTTSLDSSHSRFEKLAGSCTILSRWRAAYQQVGLLLVRDSVGHQNPDTVWTFIDWPTWLAHHRGKTVTKPLLLSRLGLPLSEKQIPQVVENLESGGKPKETLERVAMRPRQVRPPPPVTIPLLSYRQCLGRQDRRGAGFRCSVFYRVDVQCDMLNLSWDGQ